SPLLASRPPNVLVYFQFAENAKLTSPQVPLGDERILAEKNSYTTAERIQAAAASISYLEKILNQRAAPDAYGVSTRPAGAPTLSLSKPQSSYNNRELLINVCAAVPTNPIAPLQLAQLSGQQPTRH